MIMKKTVITVLLAAALSVLTLCGCGGAGGNSTSDLEYVKNKGVLKIGITEYAPMNFRDEATGEWTGFDTELAEAVAKKLGVDVEFFVLADWGAKVTELNVKNIDCVWNGMTITNDLKESMEISKPYVLNAQVVVCKSTDKEKFADASVLDSVTVAVEQGSAAEALFEGKSNTTPCQNMASTLLEVRSGAADAAVIDITMAKSMLGAGTSYEDLCYTVSLSEESYGIGFRKGSDMCAEVNSILDELSADGTLDFLAAKYGLNLAE